MNGMNPIEPSLMTIGRFAELTLLSQKALRLYDDRRILRPVEVDPLTGYRLYSADQAPTGRLISLLRAAGMPLESIATIVVSSTPTDALTVIDAFQRSLHQRTISGDVLLERARHHLTEDDMLDITTTPATDQFVLSELIYPKIEQLDDTIAAALAGLESLAATRGLTAAGDPFGVFHAPVNEDSAGPLEVCLPVDGLTGPADTIRSFRLSGAAMASVTVTGEETDFPAILAAYDRVCEWVESNGYRTAGPPRETWHTLPWADGETSMTVSWPYVVG